MANNNLNLGIDASNIRSGGGVTHLVEILRAAKPSNYGISRVIIWGGSKTLEALKDRPWLQKIKSPDLDKSLLKRIFWQRFQFTNAAQAYDCDLLFVPGGLFTGSFRPYVSMFQNMQIFETSELNREGLSLEWFRLRLLQRSQLRTFIGSSGLICLSEYSLKYIMEYYPKINDLNVRNIAHGINEIPQNQYQAEIDDSSKVLRILYVSTVKKYKHQWNLIDAVGILRKEGYNLFLELIGSGDSKALRKMHQAIDRNKIYGDYVNYHGELNHKATLNFYNKVDIFVFPSSCETFGISLLEAMNSGLPIACSDRGPMSEILKDSGRYFNPLSVKSITNCLRYLIDRPELRKKLGVKSRKYANHYSWEKCAAETFSFIQKSYKKYIS